MTPDPPPPSQKDGTWDAAGSCEAFCPPHTPLAYGTISTGVKTTVGEEVVLECIKGYTLKDPKVPTGYEVYVRETIPAWRLTLRG